MSLTRTGCGTGAAREAVPVLAVLPATARGVEYANAS
jgi:hypothetical protein